MKSIGVLEIVIFHDKIIEQTGGAVGVRDISLVDGNKRIGISVMPLLLQINNIKVQYTQSELVNLGLDIAQGILDENGIANWIHRHTI